MSDSLIISAGEDCTCRVWGPDGTQLRVIKEHIGRGVWRCLYDPSSSLLVTAGFDSAIKVHQLHSSLPETFAIQLPNSKRTTAPMDSKSEYVRCMEFASEDALYVATNNGFLYLAKIRDTDVTWTQLYCGEDQIPIVCMSVFPVEEDSPHWIGLGDGKGRLTVLRVDNLHTPQLLFTCHAEPERQLLGTYWCKSLGHRYIFTADPRGRVKLWNLCKSASLVAEFTSSFPTRIICLDASFQEEVLVCGDVRGNLVLFPLPRDLLPVADIGPLNYFKGAHGISSVSSVSIHGSNPSSFEIHSTGGDGCICYMEYDRSQQNLEFIGMKQVKELSLVRSLLATDNYYAIGFASADFIIWNLSTETKVAQIPCGGWRRPHAYFLGDIPHTKNCFAFVKGEVIYMHKQWVTTSGRIYPQNLHVQFHGREMHSVCLITQLSSESAFVATGCEDGSVRLTRYCSGSGIDKWCGSKLVGEHVGGSAVRSLCCVVKVHTMDMQGTDEEDQFLLISVGAKRVVTVWKRNSSSMSFQWISSDFPLQNEKNTENDWRHLAVTAFLVKFSGSRMCVCFVVVSCSDATLMLRALVLPHRLWFDIAQLVPCASPVLSLQHVVVPEPQNLKDKSLFIVISGSTDGSIGFWDVSEAVETFMRKASVLPKEDCSTRPRTGRGSQGGRRRASEGEGGAEEGAASQEIDTIWPLHVVKNVHQSGVNCLHVSRIKTCESCFSCNVISGGDDQALGSFCFDVMGPEKKDAAAAYRCLQNKYQIVFSHPHEIASAHSSAVKGVWTDGNWVFSTGLDQRVRCWRVSVVDGKLREHAHLIVSVPEPEALDVRVCGRNLYQIAVAGRGMQMLEFFAPSSSSIIF